MRERTNNLQGNGALRLLQFRNLHIQRGTDVSASAF